VIDAEYYINEEEEECSTKPHKTPSEHLSKFIGLRPKGRLDLVPEYMFSEDKSMSVSSKSTSKTAFSKLSLLEQHQQRRCFKLTKPLNRIACVAGNKKEARQGEVESRYDEEDEYQEREQSGQEIREESPDKAVVFLSDVVDDENRQAAFHVSNGKDKDRSWDEIQESIKKIKERLREESIQVEEDEDDDDEEEDDDDEEEEEEEEEDDDEDSDSDDEDNSIIYEQTFEDDEYREGAKVRPRLFGCLNLNDTSIWSDDESFRDAKTFESEQASLSV